MINVKCYLSAAGRDVKLRQEYYPDVNDGVIYLYTISMRDADFVEDESGFT